MYFGNTAVYIPFQRNWNDYIIFAEYDIAWFCIERSSGKCCELDKPSAQELCIFNTFEEMIKYVLRLSVKL